MQRWAGLFGSLGVLGLMEGEEQSVWNSSKTQWLRAKG